MSADPIEQVSDMSEKVKAAAMQLLASYPTPDKGVLLEQILKRALEDCQQRAKTYDPRRVPRIVRRKRSTSSRRQPKALPRLPEELKRHIMQMYTADNLPGGSRQYDIAISAREALKTVLPRKFIHVHAGTELDDFKPIIDAKLLIEIIISNCSSTNTNTPLMKALVDFTWHSLHIDAESLHETAAALIRLPGKNIGQLKSLAIYSGRDEWRETIIKDEHPDSDLETALRQLANSGQLLEANIPHSIFSTLHSTNIFNKLKKLEVSSLCSADVIQMGHTINKISSLDTLALRNECFWSLTIKAEEDKSYKGLRKIKYLTFERFNNADVNRLLRMLKPTACTRLTLIDGHDAFARNGDNVVYFDNTLWLDTAQVHMPELVAIEYNRDPTALLGYLGKRPTMLPKLKSIELHFEEKRVYTFDCSHVEDIRWNALEQTLVDVCRRYRIGGAPLAQITLNCNKAVTDLLRLQLKSLGLRLVTRTY